MSLCSVPARCALPHGDIVAEQSCSADRSAPRAAVASGCELGRCARRRACKGEGGPGRPGAVEVGCRRGQPVARETTASNAIKWSRATLDDSSGNAARGARFNIARKSQFSLSQCGMQKQLVSTTQEGSLVPFLAMWCQHEKKMPCIAPEFATFCKNTRPMLARLGTVCTNMLLG
eukprot:6180816-Pleurochrysis_carterae.AAC.2